IKVGHYRRQSNEADHRSPCGSQVRLLTAAATSFRQALNWNYLFGIHPASLHEPRSSRRKEAHSSPTRPYQSRLTSAATVQGFKARKFSWDSTHEPPRERRHPAGEFRCASLAGKEAGAPRFIVSTRVQNLEVESAHQPRF